MPTILAIDDKQDNLITLTAILKNLVPECKVITAQSGLEGIEKAKAHAPDTILLDIKMPGMDGYEVCLRLKGDEETKRIPVIMLSAIMTGSADFVKGFEAGADAYLSKPVDQYVLAAQMKSALRMKAAEDHLRMQKDLLEDRVQERTGKLAKTNALLELEVKERRQAEADLQASEERYRALFENSPIQTIIVDKAARVTMYNFANEKSEGRLPNIGNIMYKDYAANHEIDMFAQLMKCLISGEPLEFAELKYKESYLHIRLSPFSGGAIITSINITAMKQLHSQLRQSQKMEALGTMSGGIAHDFNNILAIILGNTELAIDDIPEWSPANAFLQEIFTASLRAKEVVQQFLSFARKSTIKKKPARISPIIEESLKLLRASIPASIEIHRDISCKYDTVLTDPTQINQVLMNLCVNAAHAMQETGGRMDISLNNIILDEAACARYEDLAAGTYVMLAVRDTGKGIDPQVINRIFDPYFTTKDLGEGTGMGLAVIHGIVKAHNGAIRVESNPGQGTVFKVLFPLIDAEPEPEADAPAALRGGTERILFVDDEDSIVRVQKKNLAQLGYDVVAKTDSLDALEVFKASPDEFDLIITDMTMPNMTGDKLASKILGIRPDMPIIICSGFSAKIDDNKAQTLGIRRYVEKPCAISDFAEAIRSVLDEKKGKILRLHP